MLAGEVEVGSGPSSLMERQGFGNGRRVQVLGMLRLARAKRRGGIGWIKRASD